MAETVIRNVVAPSPSKATAMVSTAVAERHLDGVAFDQPDQPVDHRIEQADIEHQAEIQDGEDDHDADRGNLGDAVEHHLAEVGTGAGQKTEEDGDENQRYQNGHALGHDRRQKDGDGRKSKGC